jgi:hypothetical protein
MHLHVTSSTVLVEESKRFFVLYRVPVITDHRGKDFVVRRTNQRSILCYRAKDVIVVNGVFAPYKTWPVHRQDKGDFQLFLTGVSGVLYPHFFLVELKRLGTKFVATCPKADDVWLNFVASQNGVEIIQLPPEGIEFPSIPMSSRGALQRVNVDGGGNDESIAALYGRPGD